MYNALQKSTNFSQYYKSPENRISTVLRAFPYHYKFNLYFTQILGPLIRDIYRNILDIFTQHLYRRIIITFL